MVFTKLNRSHLIHGRSAYLLPCRGRIEFDWQASGPQAVTIEDTSVCVHASHGIREPASEHLLSERAIIAGLKTSVAENPFVPWDEWVADYGRVRDAIERTYPSLFAGFNARMAQPGGYHDRFRGVRGTRMTVFVHRNDVERFSLAEGDIVRLPTEMGDAVSGTSTGSL